MFKQVWPDLAKFHHFAKIFKVFGKFFASLFCFWPTFKPILTNWANFHWWKWPKMEKITQSSGHTGKRWQIEREAKNEKNLNCVFLFHSLQWIRDGFVVPKNMYNNRLTGWEPWSSGWRRRLTFWRFWVQIPFRLLDGHFFTLICCKICNTCLKRPKINEKEAGNGSLRYWS